ncbi:MAG: hypothetical protein ACFFBP_13075, partial [Promethearchaeota archaeon]
EQEQEEGSIEQILDEVTRESENEVIEQIINEVNQEIDKEQEIDLLEPSGEVPIQQEIELIYEIILEEIEHGNNYFKYFLFFTFIFVYMLFFISVYIIPLELHVSIVLIIGFIVVIISFFLFINTVNKDENNLLFNIKILPENLLKIILLLLMVSSITISPITSTYSIISWVKIKPINYFRAITMILGCMYIPGASIFSIFFHDNKLHEKLRFEPYIIKLTFYPILSLSFMGVSVLIIDQIVVLNRNLFALVLLALIVSLFFIDIILQMKRNKSLNIEIKTITISKFTSFILLLSIGVALITIGIHLGIHFIIPGDSWAALTFTNEIGKSNTSPITKGSEYYYPLLWCYVIYGLSALSGFPIINTSTLLIPFNYTFILSIYILMKAILYNYKEKYAVFSTFLMSIFSALFYITTSSIRGSLPATIYIGTFYFLYKSFGIILFMLSLATFIIFTKISEERGKSNNSLISKLKNNKLSILTSFLLIISYMVYAIPFLMSILFILIYCLLADKKERNLLKFSQTFYFIIIFFIVFDLIMEFYLSYATFLLFYYFFQIGFLWIIVALLPIFILIYLILFSILIILKLIRIMYIKYFKESKRKSLIHVYNHKKFFKICLIIFTIFLILEVATIILEEFFLGFYFDEKLIFFYALDQIYLNIGIIGITATYLSYFCFKKDKKLFSVLIAWIFISFFIAVVLIIVNTVKYSTLFIGDIGASDLKLMKYWFNRIWDFSVVPLCIISSIGMIKLVKFLKSNPKFMRFFMNKKMKEILRVSSFSLFIFLAFSNLIVAALLVGNAHDRVKEEEIELFSWMSKNLPDDSEILIENSYGIRLGIFSLTNAEYHFINDYFDADDTKSEMIDEIKELRDGEIEYICLTRNFLNDDNNVSVFIRSYLIPQFYNQSEYKSENYRIYYAPYFD